VANVFLNANKNSFSSPISTESNKLSAFIKTKILFWNKSLEPRVKPLKVPFFQEIMNDLNKNTGRIVGVLFLLTLILGMYNNLFLLGPISFSKDFLNSVGTNSNAVISSVLLSLFTGILSLAIDILLYGIFKKYSKNLAMAYLIFGVIKFCFGIVDNAAVFTLLSVSNEFLQSGTATDANLYKTLGNIIGNAREMTHLIDILFGLFCYFLFFYLMLRTKLLPIFLIIFGFIASISGVTEMILNLYGINHKWHIFMLLPLALCQLLFSIWLIIKGFNSTKQIN
jgi:Domain of unknown function (DUF4386)